VAKSLRHLRTSQLISIRELAIRSGITPKTVTDIEYGRRRPNYETMRAICEALGVSPHEIHEFVVTLEARGTPRYLDTEGRPPNARPDSAGAPKL
jgi:transcriptional regulator with XRE-family HTH domain